MMTPSPANLAYFLESSAENYYGIQNEPNGYWLGSGCQNLGLLGTAKEKEIANLAAGYSPNGEQPLVQLQGYQGRKRQPGWDLTFNAPKSVSVLWGTTSNENRDSISRFHTEAIGEAFSFLEENGAFSRRKRDGQLYFERAKLVAVGFEHASSRNLDPHLHTHVVVINVAVRPDGSTGTVVSKPFWTLQKAAGAIYRSSLSNKIKESGIDGLRPGKNSFELQGISERAVRFWSSRRKEILEQAEKTGAHSFKELDLVTYQTRNDKTSIGRDELFTTWQDVSQRMEFSFRPNLGEQLSVKQVKTIAFEAVSKSISELEAAQSHFTYDQILGRACNRVEQHGIAVEQIVNSIQSTITNGQIIHLGTQQERSYFSTPALLRLEKNLGEVANDMKDRIEVFREHGTAYAAMIEKIVSQNFEQAVKTQIVTLTSAGAAECNFKYGVDSISVTRMLNPKNQIENCNLLVHNPTSFNSHQLIAILEHAKQNNCRLQFVDRKNQVRFFGPKGGYELVRREASKTDHVNESPITSPRQENVRQFDKYEQAAKALAIEWRKLDCPINEKRVAVDDPRMVSFVNAVIQTELNKSRDTSQPVSIGSGECVFKGDIILFTTDLKDYGIRAGQRYTFESISLKNDTLTLNNGKETLKTRIRGLRFASLGFASSEHQLRESDECIRFSLIDLAKAVPSQIKYDEHSRIFAYQSNSTTTMPKQSSKKIDILELCRQEPMLEHQSATGLKEQLQHET